MSFSFNRDTGTKTRVPSKEHYKTAKSSFLEILPMIIQNKLGYISSLVTEILTTLCIFFKQNIETGLFLFF
jgi:hypothetical protein